MGVIIRTELEGKINNLPHFKSEALLPVFEAVVNSIQAIEDRPQIERGEIVVSIVRDPQMMLAGDGESEKPIVGFNIEDNGIGFDDTNFESFQTSDTILKQARGCKGIGRFFWLKAFSKVEIESVYSVGKARRFRAVLFTRERGFQEIRHEATDLPQKTIVRLIGYKQEYREQPSSFKTTHKIAQRILEHCLSFYIAGAAPRITVVDKDGTISLDDMFAEVKQHLFTETFTVGTHEFGITHIKLYSTYNDVHDIVLCANRRDVCRKSIAGFLGTSQQFDEKDKKFVYTAYVSGRYLDNNVRADRISFDIPENGLLQADSQLTMDHIMKAAQQRTRIHLADYLQVLHQRKLEAANRYVSEKNPTLRAVVHYCPQALDEIEPNSSEEKIDEVLCKYKGRTEFEIRRRGQELLKTQAQSVEEIRQEYEGITEKLEGIQKDQLAAYVIFRKMIIDLLEKKLQLTGDRNFERESVIHDILFPRKASTDQLGFEEHNLWLIDERLTFHAFAASDKPLCDTTSSDSTERPDVLLFAEVDDDRIARTVSVIELKKPGREKYDEDPTKQLFRYVRNIRESKEIKTPNGRNLSVDSTTRFYCFALCDLTATVKEYAQNSNYAKLKGELGYYMYNSALNCHMEILAFNKLVADAQRRHKAFFEKLGI